MITVIEKQYGCGDQHEPHDAKAQNTGVDWEQRRYEIAKDMMAAIMNNPDIAAGVACEPKVAADIPVTLAELSVTFADALIEELRRCSLKKEKK